MMTRSQDENAKEIKRYRNWSSVPRGLVSKSRLKRDYGLNVTGRDPVAKVHQKFDNKWIDLYPIGQAKPKKTREMQARTGEQAKK